MIKPGLHVNIGVVYKDEEFERIDRLTTMVRGEVCVIFHCVFYPVLGADPWAYHINLHNSMLTNIS